jgi:hypothetical protein
MPADLSLRFTAQEDVSKASKQAADALKQLEHGLGETGKAGGEAAEGMNKAEHGAEGLGKEIFKAEAALKVLEKAFDVVKEAAEKAFEYFKEGAQLSMANERAFRALQASVGPAAKGIAELTHEIERKTGADHLHLTQVAATLAAMGLTTQEIDRALPAMQAWADVTGRDMTRAVRQLTAALEGGKLDQQLQQFEQFLGPAAAMVNTFGGQVRVLAASLENLQEAAGASITGSDELKTALGYVNDMVRDLTTHIEEGGPVIGDILVSGLRMAALAAATATTAFTDFFKVLGKLADANAWLTDHPILMPWASDEQKAQAKDAAREAHEFADGLHAVAEGGDEAQGAIDRLDAKLAVLQDKIARRNRSQKFDGSTSLKEMSLGNESGGDAFRGANVSGGKSEEEQIEEAVKADAAVYAAHEQTQMRNREFELRALDDFEKEKQDLRVKAARESAQKEAEAAKEATREQLQDEKEFKQAGIRMGLGYLDAIGQAIRGDGRGAIKSALSVLGSFLGLAIGSVLGPGGAALGSQIGGGLANFAGGFLREGGVAQQVRIPKYRSGMAFVDMDADGMLAELHPPEVVLNAGAIAKNGGIDRVAKQNNPFEPPMGDGGHGGGTVNLYLSTLVPQDAAAAVRQSIEPGMIANLSNRGSGLLVQQLRESARYPRSE